MRSFWIVSLAIWMSGIAAARADCGVPPLELLWSYPEEGARDVPVNAELWVLVPWGWGQPTARLDDVEIPLVVDPDASGVIHLVPGAMAPEQDHVLRLAFEQDRPFGADPQVRELHFRTGSASVAPLAAATVTGHDSVPEVGHSSGPCPEITSAQDCIDIGPNTLHTFETDAADVIGWALGGFVLPARCGATVRHRYWATGTACFKLRPLGPGGLLGPATEACTGELRPDGSHPVLVEHDRHAEEQAELEEQPQAAEQTELRETSEEEEQAEPAARTDADGCSITSSPGALTWPALVAVALWRRRRRG